MYTHSRIVFGRVSTSAASGRVRAKKLSRITFAGSACWKCPTFAGSGARPPTGGGVTATSAGRGAAVAVADMIVPLDLGHVVEPRRHVGRRHRQHHVLAGPED